MRISQLVGSCKSCHASRYHSCVAKHAAKTGGISARSLPHRNHQKVSPGSSPDFEPQPVVGPKRVVFLTLAGLFFILGAMGAVLPVLPTTPFLLLTSYFLSRASPRLNRWLLASRFFGPILRDWQQLGGVRPDVKVKAIMIVLLAVALSLWMTDHSSTFRWIAAAIALIGIGVILRLPVAESAEPD